MQRKNAVEFFFLIFTHYIDRDRVAQNDRKYNQLRKFQKFRMVVEIWS